MFKPNRWFIFHSLIFTGKNVSFRECTTHKRPRPATPPRTVVSLDRVHASKRSALKASEVLTRFFGSAPLTSTVTWRIIPASKWLGSPLFISHEVRPFGRVPTTLLRERKQTMDTNYFLTGMILQVPLHLKLTRWVGMVVVIYLVI